MAVPATPFRAPLFRAHEIGFLLLGSGSFGFLLLSFEAHSRTLLEVGAGTLCYALALVWIQGTEGRTAEKIRLGCNYFFALWFYGATSRITLALGCHPRDKMLLGLDNFLLGQTPALALDSWTRPWATELLSGCYLTYHLYLHTVLLWALTQSQRVIQQLSTVLFRGFGVGFLGYLLVPACGPRRAFAERFTCALNGGPLTALNDLLVAKGAAVYGSFPSLHLLITLLLLEHDWRECRRRFWWILGPALGLFTSTVYLGYHYAADLLAGALLFLLLHVAYSRCPKSL